MLSAGAWAELLEAAVIGALALAVLARAPADRLARAACLLLLSLAGTALAASLAENLSPDAADFWGRVTPYFGLASAPLLAWLAILLGRRRPAPWIGWSLLMSVVVLEIVYLANHGLWRTTPGELGPLYLLLGLRYFMHGVVALVAVRLLQRQPTGGLRLVAIGFLAYSTHETVRWLARVDRFEWAADFASLSFAFRLLAAIPLAWALVCWIRRSDKLAMAVAACAALSTIAIRFFLSDGVFSDTTVETIEVQVWRIGAYLLVAVGLWRLLPAPSTRSRLKPGPVPRGAHRRA